MGFSTDKIAIPDDLDLRKVLTENERHKIRQERSEYGTSYRDIGKMYGVKHSIVYWIIHPERYHEMKIKKNEKERQKYLSMTNDEKHKKQLNSYRSRKRKSELLSQPKNKSKMNTQENELTFGQIAIGIKFNPINCTEVDICKQRIADAIDQMNDLRNDPNSSSGKKRHASTAITMFEDAQMRAVKALTWEH